MWVRWVLGALLVETSVGGKGGQCSWCVRTANNNDKQDQSPSSTVNVVNLDSLI